MTMATATAVNAILFLPSIVLVPVSGHAPQPFEVERYIFDAVARVRQ
jgi:hypothetical protein